MAKKGTAHTQDRSANKRPAAGVSLLAKCGCGRSLSPSGECSECRANPATKQESNLNAPAGHNFGTLMVHSQPPPGVQARLKVGQPGDQYEQEADRVAEQITHASTSQAPEAGQRGVALSRVGPLVQRQPTDQTETDTPASTPEAGETAETESEVSLGLVVEDDASEVGAGQMKKTEFLDALQESVCTAADAELAAVGQTAQGCPYIERWISYYRTRDSQYIERAIHRYAPESAGAATAQDYVRIITEQVLRAVAVWAKTGEITGVPEGVSGDIGTAAAGQGTGGDSSAAGGVQFKGRDGGEVEAADPMTIQPQLGSGHALDAGSKSRMESAFGYDFSRVRVHTDATASRLSDGLKARAFTVGDHVAFGAGEYKPGTLVGDALIAHELAHVVQQGGSTSLATMQRGNAGHSALEEDADVSAVGAVASIWGGAKGRLKDIAQNASPRLRSGLRLSRCPDKEKEEAPKDISKDQAKTSNVPAAPPGDGWVRNDTPGGVKLGGGDIEGTYYVDASSTAKAQKTPARADRRTEVPNYVGAYVAFTDKSKGTDCAGGGGERIWLSHKYLKEFATSGGQSSPEPLDKWAPDIYGRHITSTKDFEDFPGIGVTGREGSAGIIRRSYHIGIVCHCKGEPTYKVMVKGFVAEFSFNLDIWFNGNDIAVRVTPGESYGGPLDWCAVPPPGFTCVDSCQTERPATEPTRQSPPPQPPKP